jgi:lipoate-protein ligase B
MSGHPISFELRRHAVDSPWRYADLDRRQREIAARVREGGPGAILLSEVSPVVTIGRRAGDGDLPGRELLARLGVELEPVDRGGLATWHGPGQWVLFVVERLDRLTGDPRGVRKAVEGLLGVALEVGRRYDASAEIRSGAETGVWGSQGKFAALGIHVDRGVLLHGLSVNAYASETSFAGIRPCGLDAPVEFLLGDLPNAAAREAAFLRLGEELKEACLKAFWSSGGAG